VAEVVKLMEEQDKSVLRLTDEQLAEIRRRRAKKIRCTFRLLKRASDLITRANEARLR
jgi:hypothetical protein